MTSARIRLHVLALLLVLTFASLIASACGTDRDDDGSAGASPPSATTAEASATASDQTGIDLEHLTEEEAQALIAALPERMAALKSYQYEVQIIPSGPVPAAQPGADIVIDPNELSSVITGAVDIQLDRSSTEWVAEGLSFSDEYAAKLADLYGDVPLDSAVIIDGQTEYQRHWYLSLIFHATPATWLRTTDILPSDVDTSRYTGSAHIQALLFNVVASGKEVEVIGWEDVRGTPSAHLTVQWDPAEALLAARTVDPTIRHEEFASLFGDGSIPIHVWINDGGRVRKIERTRTQAERSDIHPSLIPVRSPLDPLYVDLTVTSEYFGFDEPVDIEIPTSEQTLSLDDLCIATPDEPCSPPTPLDPAVQARIDAYTAEAKKLAAGVDREDLAMTTGLLETAQSHFEHARSLQFATRIKSPAATDDTASSEQEVNDLSGYVDVERGIVWVLRKGEPGGRPPVGIDYPLGASESHNSLRIAIPVFYGIVDGTPGFISLDEVGSETLAEITTTHYRITMSRLLDVAASGLDEFKLRELDALAGHDEYFDVWIDGQGRLIKGVIESYAEDSSPMRQTIVIWGYDQPVDADLPMPPLEP